MSFDDHRTVIAASAQQLRSDAAAASMADPVPTCPGWTVADLLKHHGTSAHWATRIVREGRPSNLTTAEIAAGSAAPSDRQGLLDWHAAAVADLLDALAGDIAPDTLVFLPGAPPAHEFWARRLAHDATVHRVDALSARLGHLSTAANAGVGTALAADGVDELLHGFLTRGSIGLHTDEPTTVTVAANDIDRAWTLELGPGTPVVTDGARAEPDAVLDGSAAALYLGLWNRGDEIAEHGMAPVLGLWREKVRISWA